MSERYRLLYDGACPHVQPGGADACTGAIPEAMEAVDIMAEDFDSAAYGLSAQQVRAALYGIKPDGTRNGGHGQPARSLPAGWPGLADRVDGMVAGAPGYAMVSIAGSPATA